MADQPFLQPVCPDSAPPQTRTDYQPRQLSLQEQQALIQHQIMLQKMMAQNGVYVKNATTTATKTFQPGSDAFPSDGIPTSHKKGTARGEGAKPSAGGAAFVQPSIGVTRSPAANENGMEGEENEEIEESPFPIDLKQGDTVDTLGDDSMFSFVRIIIALILAGKAALITIIFLAVGMFKLSPYAAIGPAILFLISAILLYFSTAKKVEFDREHEEIRVMEKRYLFILCPVSWSAKFSEEARVTEEGDTVRLVAGYHDVILEKGGIFSIGGSLGQWQYYLLSIGVNLKGVENREGDTLMHMMVGGHEAKADVEDDNAPEACREEGQPEEDNNAQDAIGKEDQQEEEQDGEEEQMMDEAGEGGSVDERTDSSRGSD